MHQSIYAKAQKKFYDEKTVELVNKIDYNFSTSASDSTIGKDVNARTIVIDELVTEFIEKNTNCTIVIIACVIETRFYIVDNGKITWCNCMR